MVLVIEAGVADEAEAEAEDEEEYPQLAEGALVLMMMSLQILLLEALHHHLVILVGILFEIYGLIRPCRPTSPASAKNHRQIMGFAATINRNSVRTDHH